MEYPVEKEASKTSRSDRKRQLAMTARRDRASGFTLLEVVLVITLFAFISGLALSNFDSVFAWKQKGDIRKFVDTWEFLYNEAIARRQGYRLVIDIDKNSYYVRREIIPEGTEIKNVDYLANLRTQGQKERLQEEELEELPSIAEEFEAEDAKQSGDLESLFFGVAFNDPGIPTRLGRPLEFPSLAEGKILVNGLRFKDIKTPRGLQDSGNAYIRFSPRGASEFAVIHLLAEDKLFTLFMNPSTGRVSFKEGEVDFDWLQNKQTAN